MQLFPITRSLNPRRRFCKTLVLTITTFSHTRTLLGALLLTFFCTLFGTLFCGCSSLLLQPTRTRHPLVDQEQIQPDELSFYSSDGTRLSAWHFRSISSPARALVVQWHGNAENQSYHYKLLSFLPEEGYELLTFDYRGYGESDGFPEPDGVMTDAEAMIEHAANMSVARNLPLIFVGQNLGGTMLLRALQKHTPENLRLVVIEGAFYGWREIIQDKLRSHWLIWMITPLASVLVSDRFSPASGGGVLSLLPKEIPVVLIYGTQDPVVPLNHGERLYNELREPKQLWVWQGDDHLGGLFVDFGTLRWRLLAMMNELTENPLSNVRAPPQPMRD